MGVWRWGSEMTARKRSRFPSMVTRYIDKEEDKEQRLLFFSSESPMRKNSESFVRFCGSI